MKVFSDLEVFAALLAAAAHDIGHPGVNNTFLCATGHDISVMYNDVSVLENFHASSVFKLLGREGYNIMANFSAEDNKKVRRSF
jgi:hypothetical protein